LILERIAGVDVDALVIGGAADRAHRYRVVLDPHITANQEIGDAGAGATLKDRSGVDVGTWGSGGEVDGVIEHFDRGRPAAGHAADRLSGAHELPWSQG